MAGGPFAAVVACDQCNGPAVRTYEGSETDQYRCEACGREFGVHWRQIPDRPMYPEPAPDPTPR